MQTANRRHQLPTSRHARTLPRARYEISNVSYSRSQRRRDAVAGRTPASRGMQVSQTSRRSFGATSDVNYLAVSTPLQSRRGEGENPVHVTSRGGSSLRRREMIIASCLAHLISPAAHHKKPLDAPSPPTGLSTRFSNPLEGTPSSSFKAHLPVPAGSPESTEYLGSWTGSSPHYTCKEEASDTAPSTALETATHDDASSRRRTVISTSRRPPEGAVEPLIFPRHRPGGMPMHSNPLLATRLRVAQAEDARHKQRTGRKPKDGRRRDGSKTERARRKPGWGGHDMASWARVCDVVPISPRRPVAGVAREPSVTLELPQRDPEYIPVVKTGGGEGSGFRLRHMGPWKGGVTRDRDSLCAPAKKAVWIGNLTERSPPRGVPFPGFAGERVVGVFGGDAVATRRVDALQLSHRVVVGGRRGPGEACWVAPSARRAPPVANMQPTLRGGLAVFDWARAQRWGLRACGLAAHAIGGGVVEGGVAAGGPRSRVAYDSRAGVQSGSGFMGQAGGASTPVQVHGGTGGSSAAPSSCWEGR